MLSGGRFAPHSDRWETHQRPLRAAECIARVIDKVCTNVMIYGSQNRLRLIDDHAVKFVLDCEFS